MVFVTSNKVFRISVFPSALSIPFGVCLWIAGVISRTLLQAWQASLRNDTPPAEKVAVADSRIRQISLLLIGLADMLLPVLPLHRRDF